MSSFIYIKPTTSRCTIVSRMLKYMYIFRTTMIC
nr:MAG TPA: hypothetical protein [Caudoviricetes sp.]